MPVGTADKVELAIAEQLKKINSNGILYILEIIEDNMDLKHKQEFLKIIEKRLIRLYSMKNF